MIDVELKRRHFHKQDELERLQYFAINKTQKYQSPVHLYCALMELQIHRCHDAGNKSRRISLTCSILSNVSCEIVM